MKNRSQQILLLVAIFLAGVITGSINSIGLGHRLAEERLHVDNLRSTLMGILNSELQLTPEQASKIEPIVSSACEEYRTLTLDAVHRVSRLVDAANQRIARELTASQAEKLRQLENERQELVRRKLAQDYLRKDFLAE